MAEKGIQRVIVTLNDAVAATLRAERAVAGLTTLALAERSGVPERTLMRILAAERDISVAQVEKLADALGVTPIYVVTEAERRLERARTDADALQALEDQAVTRLTEDPPS